MTSKICYADLETTSSVELKGNPYEAYALAAEVTHYVWCVGDGAVKVSDNGLAFLNDLKYCDAVVFHNAAFDLSILEFCPQVPELLREFVKTEINQDDGGCAPLCSMGMAKILNLPGSLANLVKYLRVGEKARFDFDAEKRASQDLFETPERAAERAARLREYAINDVDVMRLAVNKMLPALPVGEWDALVAHQRINSRGVHLDSDRAATERDKFELHAKAAAARFQKLVGFMPSQDMKLKIWLQRQGFPNLEDVQSDTLTSVAFKTDNQEVKEAIALRKEFVEGEHKKLAGLLKWSDSDSRLRQRFQFAEATTGRWSSKGCNLQNLKRKSLARQLLQPAPGKKLFAMDYTGVELRFALWTAGHADIVKAIVQDGYDPYMAIAREVFGNSAGPDERFKGKVGLLLSQYGGGLTPLREALELRTEEEARELREGIHRTYPGFRKTWDELAEASVNALRHDPDRVRYEVAGGKAAYERIGNTLVLHLPTGRKLAYRNARIPTDDDGLFEYVSHWPRDWHENPQALTFKKVRHGGFAMGNLCQSSCRDFLARALVRVSAIEGADIVAHVHDSIYAEVDEARADQAMFDRLYAASTLPAEELPAGLVLSADAKWAEDLS